MILSTYNARDGRALVFKERPRANIGDYLELSDGHGNSTYALVMAVRPVPPHGWEVVVPDTCPATAGWVAAEPERRVRWWARRTGNVLEWTVVACVLLFLATLIAWAVTGR